MKIFDLECDDIQPTRTGCNLVVGETVIAKTTSDIQTRREAVRSQVAELEREGHFLDGILKAVELMNQV